MSEVYCSLNAYTAPHSPALAPASVSSPKAAATKKRSVSSADTTELLKALRTQEQPDAATPVGQQHASVVEDNSDAIALVLHKSTQSIPLRTTDVAQLRDFKSSNRPRLRLGVSLRTVALFLRHSSIFYTM